MIRVAPHQLLTQTQRLRVGLGGALVVAALLVYESQTLMELCKMFEQFRVVRSAIQQSLPMS